MIKLRSCWEEWGNREGGQGRKQSMGKGVEGKFEAVGVDEGRRKGIRKEEVEIRKGREGR